MKVFVVTVDVALDDDEWMKSVAECFFKEEDAKSYCKENDGVSVIYEYTEITVK